MPLYEYECNHGHVTQAVRPIDNRHDPLPCGRCGGSTRKLMNSVAIVGMQFENSQGKGPAGAHWVEGIGDWVGSKADLRHHLDTKGLHIKEPGENIKRKRKTISTDEIKQAVEKGEAQCRNRM
jgi:putative FmdB family regulatory protein